MTGLGSGRRTLAAQVAALVVLCVVGMWFGLDDHGVTNSQEALRLTAAGEMFARGDWVVPTLRGEPYLAKPPALYWVTMSLAHLRGAGAVELVDLRAAVALGGTLGVLATFFSARVLLRDPDDDAPHGSAAFWSAAAIATGVLTVRASRVGELDIWLTVWVPACVACCVRAWRVWAERGRLAPATIAGACVMSACAALTKGPVPLAVIAIAVVLTPLVWAASAAPRPSVAVRAACGGVLGTAAAAGSVASVEAPADWLGVLLIGLIGVLIGSAASRAFAPAVWRAAWGAWWRTQPWLVLGVGVAALWGWGALVAGSIGDEAVSALARREVDENLNALVAGSPLRNAGFVAYGLLPMSIAVVAGLAWLALDRPRLSAGRLAVAVWLVGGLVLFSVLGKGVPRYLMPVWPAAAMLGGLWVVSALRDLPGRPGIAGVWRAWLGVALALSAAAQGWWYGAGRDAFNAERSPRDVAREVVGVAGVEPGRLGTFQIESLALDCHLRAAGFGSGAEEWGTRRDWRPLEGLIARVRSGGEPYFLLAAEENESTLRDFGPVLAPLREAGIGVEVIALESGWSVRPGPTAVRLLRLSGGGSGDPPGRGTLGR